MGRWTEGQRERERERETSMTKQIVTFRNFAKRPKNQSVNRA